MNKAELINAIAASTELTKKDAEKALSATLEAITNALAQGDKVQIVGFGSFEVKKRAARTGPEKGGGCESHPDTALPQRTERSAGLWYLADE